MTDVANEIENATNESSQQNSSNAHAVPQLRSVNTSVMSFDDSEIEEVELT